MKQSNCACSLPPVLISAPRYTTNYAIRLHLLCFNSFCLIIIHINVSYPGVNIVTANSSACNLRPPRSFAAISKFKTYFPWSSIWIASHDECWQNNFLSNSLSFLPILLLLLLLQWLPFPKHLRFQIHKRKVFVEVRHVIILFCLITAWATSPQLENNRWKKLTFEFDFIDAFIQHRSD